jgi:uncharacterized surface protein with fasciclin (FAS1) repeats
VNLVVAAGLDDDLRGEGPFTVFAPTDEAFAKLPKGTVETLLKPENRQQLASILSYHVVAQSIKVPLRSRNSHRLTSAKTLQGSKLAFTRAGKQVSVNGAKIVARDVRASNGYIQVIDSVLMPPVRKTIVSVAGDAGQFKTLLAAAKAAGLAEALGGKGPFTVFAPTDKAFAKLPKGAVESLLKKENRDKLAALLKYHVVPSKVSLKNAVYSKSAKTLNGARVKVSLRDGRVFVNEAGVISNDVDAGNGLIHIIDSVLMSETKKQEHSTRPTAGKKHAKAS